MPFISRCTTSAGLCLAMAACNAPSAALMKDPGALTGAAKDGIAYALVKEKWTADVWLKRRVIARPVNYDVPLCQATQLREIAPEMLGGGVCSVAYSSRDAACSNWSGCVSMEFHPSVMDDPMLWQSIVRSVNRLCESIPQEGAEVWTGFSYDPQRAGHLLGCSPARTARPTYLKRVELRASGRPTVVVNLD